MLNPRLETFYEKIICEDFIILYNFTNIAKLPKLEHAILSSTSNNFGSSKISVLQSFCGWRMVTSQKSITTRARKSIALFNIRKDTLLGLKVTLRKKSLFSLFDKALIFVLPKTVTNKSHYEKKQNDTLSIFLDKQKNKELIVSHLPKSVILALPFFLKSKQVFCNQVDKIDTLPLLKKRSTAFLNKIYANWNKQKNENFSIGFFSSDNVLNKNLKHDCSPNKKETKEKKYFFLLKKLSVKNSNKTKSFFTLSNKSALPFPEISSLSSFFDSNSGFSLTFFLKDSKILHNFMTKRKDLIKKQLLSAFGCLKD